MTTLEKHPKHRRTIAIALALFAIAFVILATLVGGYQKSSTPPRCPDGAVVMGARCCAPGQHWDEGACKGKPQSCPAGFIHGDHGCVVTASRTRVEPGSLRIGPGDWEAQGLVEARDVVVSKPYYLDTFEVTVARWRDCVDEGVCSALSDAFEPGQPVRSISYDRAEGFCRWAQGRIPSEDQWILAAAGTGVRRYPWGDTGAVCRRADWGRWRGPCAHGGSGPDWSGLIAEDRTPEGVIGLAGGVAEWVFSDEGPVIRGGSWRSQLASELRTWRREKRDPSKGYDDVGLRCSYD